MKDYKLSEIRDFCKKYFNRGKCDGCPLATKKWFGMTCMLNDGALPAWWEEEFDDEQEDLQ